MRARLAWYIFAISVKIVQWLDPKHVTVTVTKPGE